jgi:hypothetical protein
MDRDTLENWRKIRDHMERVGQTDNHYYKRALAILAGGRDPFDDDPIASITRTT